MKIRNNNDDDDEILLNVDLLLMIMLQSMMLKIYSEDDHVSDVAIAGMVNDRCQSMSTLREERNRGSQSE